VIARGLLSPPLHSPRSRSISLNGNGEIFQSHWFIHSFPVYVPWFCMYSLFLNFSISCATLCICFTNWLFYCSILSRTYRYYSLEKSLEVDRIQRHLLAFSLGYFFYDTWLSACKLGVYPGRGEIIGHHLVTSIMLGLVLVCPWPPFTELLPLCSVGLVIEFNNVFIHVRSLIDLAGMRFSLLYRANSVLVLGNYS